MKHLITIIICVAALTATAQQNITGYLNNPTVAASSTNTTPGNGVIGWNDGQVGVLQTSVIATNLASTAVVVYFDTSLNGTDWVASQYSYSVTPNGTNAATAIAKITNSVGGKWLRFGNIENPNTNAVTFSRFTLSVN